MANVAPTQGIAPGSLNSTAIHQKVLGELTKVKGISDQIGNTSLSIRKLPDKAQRKQLEVAAGSQFNISGKNSELIEISRQITSAIKVAGKSLAKNTKALFTAKAETLKALGEIEVDIASGKYSVDAAFARGKKADKIIRAAIKMAETGGLDDKATALENIKALKEFQNVPSVALALAKNAAKIAKVETETTNPALLPFLSSGANLGNDQKGGSENFGHGAKNRAA